MEHQTVPSCCDTGKKKFAETSLQKRLFHSAFQINLLKSSEPGQLLLVDVIKPAFRMSDAVMLEPRKRFDFYSIKVSRSPGRMGQQRSSTDFII